MTAVADELWKNKGRTVESYVAYPCYGQAPNEACHVYEILDCTGSQPQPVGYMDLGDAVRIFGAQNIFVSESAAMCPDCHRRLLEIIHQQFLAKMRRPN